MVLRQEAVLRQEVVLPQEAVLPLAVKEAVGADRRRMVLPLVELAVNKAAVVRAAEEAESSVVPAVRMALAPGLAHPPVE